MWKKEGMTQLHKKLYKVTKRIQQGMTPLYSVAFNFIDDRFYDYFVSAGGNGVKISLLFTKSPFKVFKLGDL
uniref:Uncharacterized protein n=1 Tax=Brassica campestris TaxID=3711 RepID=M4FJ41_BRACM